MILLDTNVVSEAMKPEPHHAVRAWLNDQAIETLYLSSVTIAELLFGVASLPAGALPSGFCTKHANLLCAAGRHKYSRDGGGRHAVNFWRVTSLA